MNELIISLVVQEATRFTQGYLKPLNQQMLIECLLCAIHCINDGEILVRVF